MEKLQWTNTFFTVCFTNYKGLYSAWLVKFGKTSNWFHLFLKSQCCTSKYYRLQHFSQLKRQTTKGMYFKLKTKDICCVRMYAKKNSLKMIFHYHPHSEVWSYSLTSPCCTRPNSIFNVGSS